MAALNIKSVSVICACVLCRCTVCLLQVECIRLPTDTGTSRLKGFGYAEFKDVDNLLAAVQLNSEVSQRGRECGPSI